MTPGGEVQGKLIGMPGSPLFGLWFGEEVLVSPIPTPYGDWFLDGSLLFVGPLGLVPQNGVLLLC